MSLDIWEVIIFILMKNVLVMKTVLIVAQQIGILAHVIMILPPVRLLFLPLTAICVMVIQQVHGSLPVLSLSVEFSAAE